MDATPQVREIVLEFLASQAANSYSR